MEAGIYSGGRNGGCGSAWSVVLQYTLSEAVKQGLIGRINGSGIDYGREWWRRGMEVTSILVNCGLRISGSDSV